MAIENAPIALFAFNRPQHLLQTVQSLAANSLCASSDLYVFVDGIRSSSDIDSVEEVKSIVENISGFRSVFKVFRERNIGLADSITSGVSELTRKFGRVIVLEDDIITSRGFLRYMNDALNQYENDSRVFQVTGYMVRNRWIAPQTGFLRIVSSWGWGTWHRAWQHYEPDASYLLEKVRAKCASEFDLGGYAFQAHDLERNSKGELKTWAVKWYASVFLEDGLCLYPKKSMVKNIGFDGSGTNCGTSSNDQSWPIKLANHIPVKRITIEEDAVYLKAMQAHYARLRRRWSKTTLRDRLAGKFKELLSSFSRQI